MAVKIIKPEINVRDKIAELDKPSGVAGEAMLRAETPQEQFNLISAGRRNLFMNGDFRIAQRGTSHTYSNSQSGYDTLDRMYSANFSSGTLALSQQHAGHDGVDAPKFLRATTASTVGASATVYSQQKIEGVELFSNKQVTISFMVKSNVDTTFQLRREYNYGSGGSTTEYDTFIDVPVTTSWTKFTHTYDAVDFSSKTIGSNNYYSIMFYWSTNQGSNKVRDGNIDITNVQIELGKVATPFEHRSYGEELALCQRYYYVIKVDDYDFIAPVQLHGSSPAQYRVVIDVPVALRKSPSITWSGLGVWYAAGSLQAGFTAIGTGYILATRNDITRVPMAMTPTSMAIAAYQVGMLSGDSTGNAQYLAFDSEL